MHRLFFIALIVLLFTGCNDPGSLRISTLSCENLNNPVGIGTTIPALSWKYVSNKNGAYQSAYQIIVATDSMFDEKKADLWNSGKTNSAESIFIPYNGKPLNSKAICYWKVRIWDQDDKASEWSPSAGFSIGLINESDWKAKYIALNSISGDICPLLRKSINITEPGEKTFIHVNSLGYHEIYINGLKAGTGVLAPAVSQFSKRSHTVTYDITSSVKQGRNDIVLWTSKGWYSKGLPGVVHDGPVVRAQLEKYAKGTWETIAVTDSLWMGRKSGYSDTGTWRAGQFGGEVVDGSLILPELTASSLDNASWTRVKEIEIPTHEASPQASEPNIITDSIKAQSIRQLDKNTWLIDMGTTLTGWTEVKFPQLKKGQEIILDYCDHLDNTGKFVNQGQIDLYVASGEGNESFRNRFNYHGYRYLKMSGISQEPLKDDITAYPIRTGYALASSFECSDKDLNEIHKMIHYTLQNLSLGSYLVDCPQIERLGYGGDGNASTQTAQIMFDLGPLYRNWLQAWADCVRDDGGMPHTAPNPYPAGGGPYWCGFIITASWRTFKNYGDIRILEKYYPVMQKWLGYAEKYSPSGLLEPWPETDYRTWYLGDWASPEGVDHTDKESVTLVNNCFMAVCYKTMQNIAKNLGKNEDAETYSARYKDIKNLINEKLFNKASGIYGSGIQIDLTYPLLSGIVPDSSREQVKENLFNEINVNRKGHIATGLVGIPVFTEWAVKEREADLFYSMLKKREYPGYLYMIDNGATTTWEHWNGARSRIHNCYNGIGSWFYEAVGGIRNDSAAYREIIIDPQIPRGVTWANTTKGTPYGTISVRWKFEEGTYEIGIDIPAGCSAKIRKPSGATGCKLNGNDVGKEGEWLEIENGKYNFTCKM